MGGWLLWAPGAMVQDGLSAWPNSPAGSTAATPEPALASSACIQQPLCGWACGIHRELGGQPQVSWVGVYVCVLTFAYPSLPTRPHLPCQILLTGLGLASSSQRTPRRTWPPSAPGVLRVVAKQSLAASPSWLTL